MYNPSIRAAEFVSLTLFFYDLQNLIPTSLLRYLTATVWSLSDTLFLFNLLGISKQKLSPPKLQHLRFVSWSWSFFCLFHSYTGVLLDLLSLLLIYAFACLPILVALLGFHEKWTFWILILFYWRNLFSFPEICIELVIICLWVLFVLIKDF